MHKHCWLNSPPPSQEVEFDYTSLSTQKSFRFLRHSVLINTNITFVFVCKAQMGLLICPVDKNCAQWAAKYLGYCLCSTKDGFSLGLGMLSVLSWTVAEIPQIMTNYNHKSADGLSLTFLVTWIIGDLFNLFGCILEPATLPTQYYMAVLYLATTSILTTQTVYYEHIYPRLKSKKRCLEAVQAGLVENKKEFSDGSDTERVNCRSSPIPLPTYSYNTSPEELYIMSARSLTVCRTPPNASLGHHRHLNSDVEQLWLKEPLIGEVVYPQSAPPPQIKTTLCVVFSMILFLGSCNRQLAEQNMVSKHLGGVVLQVGRRLLNTESSRVLGREALASDSSGVGSFLGWGMAVIYLGGRLPQIFLNIRRGNAEGLNPLMFVFAILGNATYVASILVSSLEWSKIHPNLPWLVDAGGCMLLDTFIIIQFIYFRHRKAGEGKYTT